jgi:hypothetical protein
MLVRIAKGKSRAIKIAHKTTGISAIDEPKADLECRLFFANDIAIISIVSR